MVTKTETGDAPFATTTPYVLAPGDSFVGNAPGSDVDSVRITLTAGRTYTFRLDGGGGNPLQDPYLQLHDASGEVLRYSDDEGTGLGSLITFTASTSGTYYLSVGASPGYEGGSTYVLQTAETGSTGGGGTGGFWTTGQVATYLSDGYWQAQGGGRRAFDVSQDTVVTYDVSGLTAEERRLALAALEAWQDVSRLRFVEGAPGRSELTLTHNDPSGAYSTSSTSGGRILSSIVNVPTAWVNSSGTGFDSYSYQTYIHEIGHALGLGHAGPYNGDAVYGRDNLYANDSWQMSVMSYFSQTDNTAINASLAFVATPMMADIAAIARLYGAATGLRTGNSVYGDGQTVGGSHANAMRALTADGEGVAMTIVDHGGVDTLSFYGSSAAQVIDLHAGAFSSVHGETANLAIMTGTVIENAVGGTGNDKLVGNAVANWLRGGAGNDVLRGEFGDDTLDGGAGNDRLEGGLGNDRYWWAPGDTIVDAGGIDTVISGWAITLAAGLENAILTGTANVGATGNGLANSLTGNAGANRLTGGGGLDRLIGQGGNDTYVIDSSDTVIEAVGGGIDAAIAWSDMTLAANVEALTLAAGSAALRATGNALANVITGNERANILAGAGGIDCLIGGAGNDTYQMFDADIIVETATGGTDTIMAAVSLTMADNVEILQMTGTGALTAIGSAQANTIFGNAAANRLNGAGGNDRLTGGEGADVFVFTAGSDTVTDFRNNIDTLQISRGLFGGRIAAVAEVLSHAHMEGTDAVFAFSGGHMLRVQGAGSLAALTDDLIVA